MHYSSKTKERILKVLRDNGDLIKKGGGITLETSLSIAEKIGLSYDTTSRYLCRMAQEGLIERKAMAEPKPTVLYEKGPWRFYYPALMN